jgi:N-dimethylarginine dimethylaminohydrolase
LRRGDFSRWIGDVFGNHALERELQRHERRDEKTEHREAFDQIVAAIRPRYDLTDESDVATVQGLDQPRGNMT